MPHVEQNLPMLKFNMALPAMLFSVVMASVGARIGVGEGVGVGEGEEEEGGGDGDVAVVVIRSGEGEGEGEGGIPVVAAGSGGIPVVAAGSGVAAPTFFFLAGVMWLQAHTT